MGWNWVAELLLVILSKISLDRDPLSANHAAANCFDALYLRFPEIHNQAVAAVVKPKSLAFPSKLLPKCWIMCPGDL